jgi:hypothetical protein
MRCGKPERRWLREGRCGRSEIKVAWLPAREDDDVGELLLRPVVVACGIWSYGRSREREGERERERERERGKEGDGKGMICTGGWAVSEYPTSEGWV